MQSITIRPRPIALIIALSLILTGASFGSTNEIQIVVEPGAPFAELNVGGVSVISYEDPLYGTLTLGGHGFYYYPNDAFWAVGHDIVMVEVNSGGGTIERRYILAAGRLSLENNNVYAMESPGPGIVYENWVPKDVTTVPGTVATNAYEMLVDPDNGFYPSLKADDDDTAGHQQTSEHVVNVTVDDLELFSFPQGQDRTLVFFQLKQGSLTIAKMVARYSAIEHGWQIRPTRSDNNSNLPFKTLETGFSEVRLVRWGVPGNSGADFYVGQEYIGTLTGLPALSSSPVSAEVTVEQTPEHDGLVMRFENPTFVTGTDLVDPGTRLAHSDFGVGISGLQSIPGTWDAMEGGAYMSYSPQTLAGPGKQLDIDMGAIPHWQHAYLREDFVSDPLTHYKARFWMDPTALNMPEGQSMRLVYGCRNSAASWCVDFRLGLTKVNGEYELNLYVWEDNGTIHTINQPISNAPQWIEIHYQTSLAAAVSTGWAEMWVNGVSAGRLKNLANYNSTLEDVRFGTNYTSVQVTGTVSLDEIYTWHQE